MKRRLSALLLLLPSASFAADAELKALVKALGKQVQQLTQRVTDLESELARERQARLQQPMPGAATVGAAKAPDKAVGMPKDPIKRWSQTPPPAPPPPPKDKPASAGEAKGFIKIPGTDTSIALGGYAKMDAIYSSIGASNIGTNSFGDQILLLGAIPVGPARLGENSQTTLQAKESRFWLKSATPSAYGDINAYLEFDWFGAADSYTPRLRHAYGSLGHFLGGQTWTTFLNVSAIPETLDLGSPVAIGTLRQPMLRWTQPFSFAATPMDFQAALESPNTRLSFAASPTILSPDDNRYPDIVARLNAAPTWGEWSLAAMARQIRYAPSAGPALAQWGGAVSLAGKIKLFDLDNIRFSLNYGNVLGRYISLTTFGDAVIDNSARTMNLADTYSAMVSYQHWWSDRWRSTVAYGFAQTGLPAFANGGLTRQGQSVHANLLWSPLLQTTFGVEYIYATRSLENGLHGDLHRVQFSSRFNF